MDMCVHIRRRIVVVFVAPVVAIVAAAIVVVLRCFLLLGPVRYDDHKSEGFPFPLGAAEEEVDMIASLALLRAAGSALKGMGGRAPAKLFSCVEDLR